MATSGPPPPNLVPPFPLAGQPDLVRASQKDDSYSRALADGAADAARQVFGPATAARWSAEVSAAARLLYHGSTTGNGGIQTPGEEYCDLFQASSLDGAPPGILRRWSLVVLKSLGPYAAVAAERSRRRRREERERRGGGGDGDDGAGPSTTTPSPSPPPSLRARAASAFSRLAALARDAADAAADDPSVAENAARLHLALFYLYGVYYHFPNRFSGIRLAFAGKGSNANFSVNADGTRGRPTYSVLGVFLAAQLAVAGGSAALRARKRSRDAAAAERGRAAIEALAPSSPTAASASAATTAAVLSAAATHAVVLRDDGTVARVRDEEEREPPPSPSAATEAKSRCALCLARRRFPTSTPCGHVFCWSCVAEWGTSYKRECPLCRSPFELRELVRVVGSDF